MITGKNYIGNSLSVKGSKTYETFDPQLNMEIEWNFRNQAMGAPCILSALAPGSAAQCLKKS